MKINPCPSCGGKYCHDGKIGYWANITETAYGNKYQTHVFECEGCGRQGVSHISKKDAAKEWNINEFDTKE